MNEDMSILHSPPPQKIVVLLVRLPSPPPQPNPTRESRTQSQAGSVLCDLVPTGAQRVGEEGGDVGAVVGVDQAQRIPAERASQYRISLCITIRVTCRALHTLSQRASLSDRQTERQTAHTTHARPVATLTVRLPPSRASRMHHYVAGRAP